jgi:hypothetical protein
MMAIRKYQKMDYCSQLWFSSSQTALFQLENVYKTLHFKISGKGRRNCIHWKPRNKIVPNFYKDKNKTLHFQDLWQRKKKLYSLKPRNKTVPNFYKDKIKMLPQTRCWVKPRDDTVASD